MKKIYQLLFSLSLIISAQAQTFHPSEYVRSFLNTLPPTDATFNCNVSYSGISLTNGPTGVAFDATRFVRDATFFPPQIVFTYDNLLPPAQSALFNNTVSLWVKPDFGSLPNGTIFNLFTWGGKMTYYLERTSNTNVQLHSYWNILNSSNSNPEWYGGVVHTFQTSELVNWVNLTLTFAGNSTARDITLTINGTQSFTINGSISDNFPLNIEATDNKFNIGFDPNISDRRFNGDMRNFRFFTTALSASEILALYQNPNTFPDVASLPAPTITGFPAEINGFSYLCLGETYNAAPGGSTSYSSYQWILPEGTVVNSTNLSYTVDSFFNGFLQNIKLVGFDTNNNASDTAVFEFFVTDMERDFKLQDRIACEDFTFGLTIFTNGLGDYNWYNGETTASITIFPPYPSTYWGTFSRTGCVYRDTATISTLPSYNQTLDIALCVGESYTIDTFNYNVFPNEVNSVTFNSDTVYTFHYYSNPDFCDSVVTFNISVVQDIAIVQNGALLTATAGFETYEWYNTNAPQTILGSGTQFTAPSSGNYTVRATSASGCEKTESAEVVLSSINSLSVNSSIKLYPNPTRDVLNIELKEMATVEIFSITGVKISQMNGATNYQFNTSSLADGLYFVKAGEQTLKFVKN